MRTRYHDATVIVHTATGSAVRLHHSIIVDDTRVAAIGAADELARQPVDEAVDASRLLIVPGFVNTHHHLFQTLTRGLRPVQTATLFQWLTALYQRWQHVDFEALKMAAQISIAELLVGGCTTTSDHHYLFPQGSDVRLEAILEAAELLGIRIHSCRGSMTMGQSKGGLPPDKCVEDDAAVIRDCTRVLDRFHDPKPGAMRRIDLAPCAPFNVSPELLRDTAVMARERRVLLHTHAAETLDEEKYCEDRFHCRPIEYLRQHHWLGPDVYLAHCVHLNDAEIDLLAKTRTSVAHCPSSNMRLGSGVPPIRKLLDRGVTVGLGVDGSSSNDGGSLVREARQSMLLQRVVYGPTAVTPAEAFTLGTLGGATVLNRAELGNIAVGNPADMAMFRMDDIAFAGSMVQDPLGALILCQSPRPERVVVNGRVVVKDGRIAPIDQDRLVASFNELVGKRFSR